MRRLKLLESTTQAELNRHMATYQKLYGVKADTILFFNTKGKLARSIRIVSAQNQ